MVSTSDWIRSGGGLVMFQVPPPVISRLLSVTWRRPSTWPHSWAMVQREATEVMTALGRPAGCAAHPFSGGTVERRK